MAKAELKTKTTEVSVSDFIAAIEEDRRRADAEALDAIMRRVTRQEPKMWGPSIVGYGSYDYKYESGREGTMCRAGFSPRKAALTIYGLGSYFAEAGDAENVSRLGKHSTGKGCLYVKKLSDIDLAVLEQMLTQAWQRSFETYPD